MPRTGRLHANSKTTRLGPSRAGRKVCRRGKKSRLLECRRWSVMPLENVHSICQSQQGGKKYGVLIIVCIALLSIFLTGEKLRQKRTCTRMGTNPCLLHARPPKNLPRTSFSHRTFEPCFASTRHRLPVPGAVGHIRIAIRPLVMSQHSDQISKDVPGSRFCAGARALNIISLRRGCTPHTYMHSRFSFLSARYTF